MNGTKAILTALLIMAFMVGSAMCLPSTYDLRDVNGTNYMTPLQNQGYACGSCWSFAAVACMESAYKIHVDSTMDIDLSEQYFVSDCFMQGDCGGGYAVDAFERAYTTGVPTEECFPYLGSNSPCNPCDNWEEDAFKISGYKMVTKSTIAYKEAIMEYGPIASQTDYPTHIVCVMGWNDSTGDWIVKYPPGSCCYSTIPFGDLGNIGGGYVVTGVLKEWHTPISAHASSNLTSYPAEKAIDGQYRSYLDAWRSDYEIPCWIQFDIGEPMDVDSVYMALYDWGVSTRFDIDVSHNNVTWHNIVEDGVVPMPCHMFEVPVDEEIRYVKLTIVDGNFGMCYEFGVIPAYSCPGDINSDGAVDDTDKQLVLDNWGATGGVCDLNADGIVDITDLFIVLNNWGPCP